MSRIDPSGSRVWPAFRFVQLGAVVSLIAAVSATLVAASDDRPVPSSEGTVNRGDFVRALQESAVEQKMSPLGYWGTDPEKYSGWTSHSNRLIPVYTYGTRGAGKGIEVGSWSGPNSPYRSADQVRKLYGIVPERTVNPEATWMDQTNVYDIQKAAAAGRKHIFLVVFDGMDWQTTQAAAIYNSGVVYTEGKGAGTHFQNYTADGTAEYSFMATSPHNEGTDADASSQTVTNPGGEVRGGYDASAAGMTPWQVPGDASYLIGKPNDGNPKHAYTDSSSAACSMTGGTKQYNGAINVDPSGQPLTTIAHELQQQGFAVGAVSSVPISHATPAASYAHNVTRQDFQDLTRDMLGLPSVQHPDSPLSGLDVVIGGGFGVTGDKGKDQGDNYVPGNIYLTDDDLGQIEVSNGGRYVTAVRSEGQSGAALLKAAAKQAVDGRHRLFGFFGLGEYNGHLPYATADGGFDPVRGVGKKTEDYTAADLTENPSLAQMTESAIDVLAQNPKGFWLMVEAGDVDWANHDNNIDSSIGAVNSGDAAVKVITDWVEKNSNWSESVVIVTADHGHMWNLTDPTRLVRECSAPKAGDQ